MISPRHTFARWCSIDWARPFTVEPRGGPLLDRALEERIRADERRRVLAQENTACGQRPMSPEHFESLDDYLHHLVNVHGLEENTELWHAGRERFDVLHAEAHRAGS